MVQARELPRTAMRVGRYELLRTIAGGSTAEIVLARMLGVGDFHKIVVLKFLRAELAAHDELRDAFVREARIAAQLDHPNIVHTFDVGIADERHFIAMEYVHGETVAALLARGGALPRPAALRIVLDVLSALSHAHDREGGDGPLGIVHRDVAPANVLVGYEGHVVLVDFGVARAGAWEDLTYTGQIKGTVGYLAPEQARGQRVDHRVDLFGAGMLLAHVLTGISPRAGRTDIDVVRRIAAGEVETPQGEGERRIPAAIAAVIATATAAVPSQRFASAAAMHTALVAAIGDAPVASSAELAELVRSRFGVRAHPSAASASWFSTGGLAAGPAAPPARRPVATPTHRRRRAPLVVLAVGSFTIAAVVFAVRGREPAAPAVAEPPPSAAPVVRVASPPPVPVPAVAVTREPVASQPRGRGERAGPPRTSPRATRRAETSRPRDPDAALPTREHP